MGYSVANSASGAHELAAGTVSGHGQLYLVVELVAVHAAPSTAALPWKSVMRGSEMHHMLSWEQRSVTVCPRTRVRWWAGGN